ncbi:MAG: hypothetical protein ACE5JB_15165 [bacterium]
MSDRTRAIESIINLAKQIGPRLIEIEQQLHKDVYFGSKEANTADFIIQALKNLGFEGRQITKNAIILELLGKDPSPTIALQINIDSSRFARSFDNVFSFNAARDMENVSLDIYAATGLGVTWVLNHFKSEIAGRIRILFLPVQEFHSGDSSKMINEIAFENVKVGYGLYIDPTIPIGSVGIKFGPIVPSKNTFSIEITSKTADIVNPRMAVDKIQVAAQIITALNQLSGRRIDPLKPVNISIYSIQNEYSNQECSGSVLMQGLYHTLDADVQEQIPSLIENTVQGISKAYGVEYKLEFTGNSPILPNDRATTMNLKMAAEEILGMDKVINIKYPDVGVENFTHYLKYVPGTLVHLGAKSYQIPQEFLQFNIFHIDKHGFETGVKVLSWALIRFLTSYSVS